MKKIFSLITSLALMFMLVSCGGSSSSDSSSGTALTSINGSWKSNCYVDPVFLPGNSVDVLATFNNGAATGIATTYGDITCTNIAMQETPTATYILGSAVTVDGSVDGITTATKIDYTDTTVGSPDIGEKSYDIIAIKDNKLYQGNTDGANDGTTDALRPTQLDDSVVFTKQ
jgi:hypothetical protein